jgi:hypothetical protein
MLSLVERRPIRLIGVGIYDLSPELALQLSFDDVFSDAAQPDEQLGSLLDDLGERYGLDFRGNADKLAQTGVLHRTVEYMRKRAAAAKE